MKRKLICFLISVLLLTIFFSGCLEEEKKSINIQGLINNALSGDTISIPSGIYFENIVINKSITLIGENKDNVIITSGNENTPIFNINNQNNVTIENLTIRGSTSSGIWVNSSSDVEINNCIIYDCQFHGINLESCINCKVSSCDISQCGSDNFYGIAVTSIFSMSSRNSIYKCLIHNSYGGVGIFWSNNTENIISNCTMINNDAYGIRLKWITSKNIIKNCTILNNSEGISLEYWCNNTIVEHCNISNNIEIGLDNYISSNNTFKNNIIANNAQGISIWNNDSLDIKIHHNNFINNQHHIDAPGDLAILFDDGTEGNYWYDYTGVDYDEDGIGDTPYEILSLLESYVVGQDRFPLMSPVEI